MSGLNKEEFDADVEEEESLIEKLKVNTQALWYTSILFSAADVLKIIAEKESNKALLFLSEEITKVAYVMQDDNKTEVNKSIGLISILTNYIKYIFSKKDI